MLIKTFMTPFLGVLMVLAVCSTSAFAQLRMVEGDSTKLEIFSAETQKFYQVSKGMDNRSTGKYWGRSGFQEPLENRFALKDLELLSSDAIFQLSMQNPDLHDDEFKRNFEYYFMQVEGDTSYMPIFDSETGMRLCCILDLLDY